jgi:hypothetical protein
MVREKITWEIEELQKQLKAALSNYRHHYPKDVRHVLFEYSLCKSKFLQPMDVKKLTGSTFTGKLVFKNAEGGIVGIDKVTNLTLVGSDDTIGTVTLNGTDGTYSGQGIKAGTLTLTASLTNDAGQTITGSSTITFADDTTVVSVDVVVD